MKDLKKYVVIVQKKLKPIVRHHGFILIIALLSFLIFTVLSVNLIIQRPTDDAYREEATKNSITTKFDQATIDRIKLLKRNTESINLDLSSRKRFSPFVE
jgi:hypothetical protein